MLNWEMLRPDVTLDRLGFIPEWLSESDPDPAWMQIHKHYGHGGGWHSGRRWFRAMLPDHSLVPDNDEDPNLAPLARARLRGELVLFYEHAWVAVVQLDRSFDLARID